MEDEEVDWEIDEEQHTRRVSMNGTTDDDDAVSLGPDDDDPDYYVQGDGKGAPEHAEGAEPLGDANTDGNTSKNANATYHRQSSLTRQNSGSSLRAASPQRSLSSKPLGIHGLPPKPSPAVTYNAIRNSAHPSLTAATSMSRSTAPHSKTKSGPSTSKDTPLPPGWEIREASSQKGAIYYYHEATNVTQWERPVSRASSSNDDRHYRPEPPPTAPNAARSSNKRHGRAPDQPRLSNNDTWYGAAYEDPQAAGPPSRPRGGRSPSPPHWDARAASGRPSRNGARPTNYDRRSVTPPPVSRRYHVSDTPPQPRKAPSGPSDRMSHPNDRRRERDSPEPKTIPNKSRFGSPPGPVMSTPLPPGILLPIATDVHLRSRGSRWGPPGTDVTMNDPEATSPSNTTNLSSIPSSSDTRPSQPSARAKRQPLPPQESRFRLASRGGEPSSDTAVVETPADISQAQAPVIPSGPRSQTRPKKTYPSKEYPTPQNNDVPGDLPRGPRAMQGGSPAIAQPTFPRARSPLRNNNNGWAPPEGPAMMFPMERGQGRPGRGRDFGSGTNSTPIGARKPNAHPGMSQNGPPPSMLAVFETARDEESPIRFDVAVLPRTNDRGRDGLLSEFERAPPPHRSMRPDKDLESMRSSPPAELYETSKVRNDRDRYEPLDPPEKMSRWSNARGSHDPTHREYEKDDVTPPPEPRRTTRFDQGPPDPPSERLARRYSGPSGERYKSKYTDDDEATPKVKPYAPIDTEALWNEEPTYGPLKPGDRRPPQEVWDEMHGIKLKPLQHDLPSKPQGLPSNWEGEREGSGRERDHERDRGGANAIASGSGSSRPDIVSTGSSLLARLGEKDSASTNILDRMAPSKRDRDDDETMDSPDDSKRKKRKGGGRRSDRNVHGHGHGRPRVTV